MTRITITEQFRRAATNSGLYTNGGDAESYMAARAYRYWRQSPGTLSGTADKYTRRGDRLSRQPVTATAALARARKDGAERTARYPRPSATAGAPFGDGIRWAERPAAVGLRWVGWADDLAGRMVTHTGWFTDDEGLIGDTLRGCVYQLPGRDGRAIYVPAYRFGDRRKDGTWSPAIDGTSAAMSLGDLVTGELDDGYSLPGAGATQAAVIADSVARIQAEAERDWQRAWRAGLDYSEAGAQLAEIRDRALQIIDERKEACRRFGRDGFAAMAGAIDEKIADLIDQRRDVMVERRQLREECPPTLAAAFNDGAGAEILPA